MRNHADKNDYKENELGKNGIVQRYIAAARKVDVLAKSNVTCLKTISAGTQENEKDDASLLEGTTAFIVNEQTF